MSLKFCPSIEQAPCCCCLQSHVFCGKCGSQTLSIEVGGKRQCTADPAHREYPRTDPVVCPKNPTAPTPHCESLTSCGPGIAGYMPPCWAAGSTSTHEQTSSTCKADGLSANFFVLTDFVHRQSCLWSQWMASMLCWGAPGR